MCIRYAFTYMLHCIHACTYTCMHIQTQANVKSTSLDGVRAVSGRLPHTHTPPVDLHVWVHFEATKHGYRYKYIDARCARTPMHSLALLFFCINPTPILRTRTHTPMHIHAHIPSRAFPSSFSLALALTLALALALALALTLALTLCARTNSLLPFYFSPSLFTSFSLSPDGSSITLLSSPSRFPGLALACKFYLSRS